MAGSPSPFPSSLLLLLVLLLLPALAAPASTGANQLRSDLDDVHIVALWTPQTTLLYREWTRLMTTAVDLDASERRYTIHAHRYHYGALETRAITKGSNNGFMSELWKAAVAAKLEVIYALARRLPLGARIVVSDLDVSPFRSLVPLIEFHDRSRNDFSFLAESSAGSAAEVKVNCGFQMLTVTAETRRMLLWWLLQRGDEQLVINWWLRETQFGTNATKLLELPGGDEKRWPRQKAKSESLPLPPPVVGTFPRHLATVMLKEITKETAVYHAVGVSGNSKKLALQARAVAIASRCRNATDAGDEWRAFVHGDARFEAIVRGEAARLAPMHSMKPATRTARLREWCADGPAFIKSLYGTGGLYGA